MNIVVKKKEEEKTNDEQLMKEKANWQIAGDHQPHRGLQLGNNNKICMEGW